MRKTVAFLAIALACVLCISTQAFATVKYNGRTWNNDKSFQYPHFSYKMRENNGTWPDKMAESFAGLGYSHDASTNSVNYGAFNRLMIAFDKGSESGLTVQCRVERHAPDGDWVSGWVTLNSGFQEIGLADERVFTGVSFKFSGAGSEHYTLSYNIHAFGHDESIDASLKSITKNGEALSTWNNQELDGFNVKMLINKHTVTYKAAYTNGTSHDAPANYTKTVGHHDIIPKSTMSAPTGYHHKSDSDNGNGATQCANDQTVTRTFEPNTWTLKYNSNGGTGSIANVTMTYDGNAATVPSSGFTRSGYTLHHFSTESAGGTNYSLGGSVSANTVTTNGGELTLYARWFENAKVRLNSWDESLNNRPQGDALLSGQTWELTNKDTGAVLATLTSNEHGLVESDPVMQWGNYRLKRTAKSTGYRDFAVSYLISVPENGTAPTMTRETLASSLLP